VLAGSRVVLPGARQWHTRPVERVPDVGPATVSDWDLTLGEYSDGWRDKDYRQLEELFRLGRLAGTLIDVGCAVGDGLSTLRRACKGTAQFSGCDFSAEGIRISATRFPDVEFFVHDIHKPLPRTWTSVISLQTIEHLDDPVTAVKNLAEAATDTLIVAAPYRNRRPDRDHRWSFDVADFAGMFDGWLLDRAHRNIYWYRSTVDGVVRHPLEVRTRALSAGVRRRVRRLVRPARATG
jgi:trans-aconitate methyltransferase